MNSAKVTRRAFLSGAAALGAFALAGCGGQGGQGGQSGSKDAAAVVKIGTMPTEDLLPMYVATAEGLFEKAGVDGQVIVFDSAQTLSAAITAGEVDLAMTDPMRTAKLVESGVPLSMEWITLGEDASQGRFGILAPADTKCKTMADLAKLADDATGIGVAANTVPEYVMDKLAEAAGVKPADLPVSEIPSLPDRFSLLASGKLDAAALPGSLLALGEAMGMKVIADDSKGENLSQSVMVARTAFMDEAGQAAVAKVREAWDAAAKLINENPENYRQILIENANLNEKVADSYPISTYPLSTKEGKSAFPPAELIEPQLEWMKAKGYLTKGLTYNAADGTFAG